MFRKRVFILFFIFILFNLSAESDISSSDKKIVDEVNNNSPNNFFTIGELTINEEIKQIVIYIEKNRDNFNNLSIKVDDELLKVTNSVTESKFNKNGKKVTNNFPFLDTTIPLSVINHVNRNSDYLIIDKPSRFTYKNLKCYKILVKEKEKLEIEEEMTDITDQMSAIQTSVTKVKDLDPEVFQKTIYYISDISSIILKKEFYKNKDDRDPAYTIDSESINYINNHYIVTEWKITDIKSKQEIKFRYNIETMIYNKEDILREFNTLTSFYGVR
jgi:hypothetical protein